MEERMIRHMLGLVPAPERRPLDVFPVPPALVDEFYRRYLNFIELEESFSSYPEDSIPDLIACKMGFWAWVEEAIPASAGKDLEIDITNVTRPIINVIGEKTVPTVGRKFLQVIKIADDNMPEIIKLSNANTYAEATHKKHLVVKARYELWKRLTELHPEAHVGTWGIQITRSAIWLLKEAGDNEDELED